jgi:periplasmic divalent cation tolerance protein
VTADCVQVTVTAASREEADRIAADAVEHRVAACARVSGPIASVFRWNGRLDRAVEWTCQLKTTSGRYPELEARIRALHSYTNPEIIATTIVAGSREYLDWLRAETTP